MVWKYLRNSELQVHLERLEPKLFERLIKILPGLSEEWSDQTKIYERSNIIKVIEAFSPSSTFHDRNFVRYCLNRLPPDKLRDLSSAIGITSELPFDELLEKIVSLGWSDSEFCQKFLNHFQLPDHFMPAPKETPPDYEHIDPPTVESPIQITSAYKTLKDYQFRVFHNAQEELKMSLARFIIQMPTGAGKTRTAMELITHYINSSPNDDVVVIWLAHSDELCEQALVCFRDIWRHVSRRSLTVYRAWGNHDIPSIQKGSVFIVGGFKKFHSAATKNSNVITELQERTGLVVVDEAHRTVAPTFKEVIRKLLNKSTQVVGLTATPGRTIIEETEELSEFYFSKIVDIEAPGNGSVISMLRKLKVLAEIEFEPIITGIEYALTPQQKKQLERHFDFPKKFLEKLEVDDVRNAEIVMRLLEECRSGKSILFFGCSVKHSKFIAALLIFLEVKAAHVDGSTNLQRRRQIISQFRSRELQVLCNYGVLSEGFDAPNTDVVCIARPTNSAVLYSQMLGRGLRGPEIGGNQSCKIIDVRDNIVGFGDADQIYRYFRDFWN